MRARWRRARGGDGATTGSTTPLDGILDEVRDLRLTFTADLSAAAGAADAGADAVARDIVEADRRELARFARVTEQQLLRLQRVAVPDQQAPRWRRRLAIALPAVPLVGAMALSAAAATGVLPLPGGHAGSTAVAAPRSGAPLNATFEELVSVVHGDPTASQVIAAATALHEQLAAMIATTAHNPAEAQEIARLLEMERSLLLTARPPGASVVLAASSRLVAQLTTQVPVLVSPSVSSSLFATATSTARPATKPKSTSSPSPSKSASPTPSVSPDSTATPTPTPTSTATAPGTNPLPNFAG